MAFASAYNQSIAQMLDFDFVVKVYLSFWLVTYVMTNKEHSVVEVA